MYLLSIIPVGLTPGTKPLDPNDKVSSIEKKIKDLEGLLSSSWLGQDFDADLQIPGSQRLDQKYYGGNEVKVYLVKKDLEDARKEDIELRKELGMTSPDTNRLDEINYKILAAEQRMRDLNGLAEAIKKDEEFDADPNIPGVQPVSGLSTPQNPNGAHDLNLINFVMTQTELYKKELEAAKEFWKSLNLTPTT